MDRRQNHIIFIIFTACWLIFETVSSHAAMNIIYCIDNTADLHADTVHSWIDLINNLSKQTDYHVTYVPLDDKPKNQSQASSARDTFECSDNERKLNETIKFIIDKKHNNKLVIISRMAPRVDTPLSYNDLTELKGFFDKLSHAQNGLSEIHFIHLVSKIPTIDNENKSFEMLIDEYNTRGDYEQLDIEYLITLMTKSLLKAKKSYTFFPYMVVMDEPNEDIHNINKWILHRTTDDAHVYIDLHSSLFENVNEDEIKKQIKSINEQLEMSAPKSIHQNPWKKLTWMIHRTDKPFQFFRHDYQNYVHNKQFYKRYYTLHIEKSHTGPFAHFYLLHTDIDQLNRYILDPGRCWYFVPCHTTDYLAVKINEILNRLSGYYKTDFPVEYITKTIQLKTDNFRNLSVKSLVNFRLRGILDSKECSQKNDAFRDSNPINEKGQCQMDIRSQGKLNLCLRAPENNKFIPTYIGTIEKSDQDIITVKLPTDLSFVNVFCDVYNNQMCSQKTQHHPWLFIYKQGGQPIYKARPCISKNEVFKAFAGDTYQYHLTTPADSDKHCLNQWFQPLDIPENKNKLIIPLTCQEDKMFNYEDKKRFFCVWHKKSPCEKIDHIFGSPHFFYQLIQFTQDFDAIAQTANGCTSYTTIWSETLDLIMLENSEKSNGTWINVDCHPSLMEDLSKDKISVMLEPGLDKTNSIINRKKIPWFKHILDYVSSK
jgi:hypothetical protein